MVRVDRTGFAPLAVGVSKRKDYGKEDETLIVMAHPDVNLGVGVIERHRHAQLSAALIQRMLVPSGVRLIESTRLRVSTRFPPSFGHNAKP